MNKIKINSSDIFIDGNMAKPGSGNKDSIMAVFYFENDLAFLFPYINAVATGAELYENPAFIRFILNKVHCVVYPGRCLVTPLKNREHVEKIKKDILFFLNDIFEKKNKITPKFKLFQPIPITTILKLLPKTNCGDCGFNTCVAFAAMVSRQRTAPSRCPHIGLPLKEQVTYPVYDDTGTRVSSITIDVDTSNAHDDSPLPYKKTTILQTKTLNAANSSLPSALTKRELQVLSMIGAGLTNKEISNRLHISAHTVKSHVVNIFNKLGVNHRTQAVVWAARNELI
ncbi:Putative Fe-S cluster [Desulfocicer vacuolatum DSM 3385]|uniref:Putative Fe-S cluster n=1 Tax=Desulfocicer vacuolatum DSM 3385 TaxID=1121400 RepID=A0A1W1YTV8_9BACT|nr:LuxR C-terminal-related transcriptional regulator [Desulfocicer vacuolatum]SMC39584.1 Putative Fe-S cluster [Desulfocicer vacuolatum DSM 3385]